MFGEVENEDLAAGFEDPVGFFDGALRVLGVVEGLAEDGEVHGGVGERDALDIAEFVGEVGEAALAASSVPTSTMRGSCRYTRPARRVGRGAGRRDLRRRRDRRS